jgi:hypothetical protein
MSITARSKHLAGYLLVVLLAGATPVFAECLPDGKGTTICGPGPCASDANGDVFCAPHEHGSVIRKDSGEVVCGWGACAAGAYGGYFCSIDPEGDISADGGDIACKGGCEVATTALCEQSPQQL